jgi:hypothetical protein
VYWNNGTFFSSKGYPAGFTGCRDQGICQLRWEWEVPVPGLSTSVFLIPGRMTKNGDNRLVVLNRIATSVVESCRGGIRNVCSLIRVSPPAGC